MIPVVHRAGERAVLVDLPGLDDVLDLDRVVRDLTGRDEAWAAVEDVVPAATTLLVVARSAAAMKELRPRLDALLAATGFRAAVGDPTHERSSATTIKVPVHYDGEDLDDVARLVGLSPAEVVAAHTGRPWRVAFGGFAPGFAYLVEGDPRLEVPRRPEPRTAVPAGAVGLAGTFSGVYPRQSPGGWQLIGHTDLAMWDIHRDPPALLQPGSLVQFVDGDAA